MRLSSEREYSEGTNPLKCILHQNLKAKILKSTQDGAPHTPNLLQALQLTQQQQHHLERLPLTPCLRALQPLQSLSQAQPASDYPTWDRTALQLSLPHYHLWTIPHLQSQTLPHAETITHDQPCFPKISPNRRTRRWSSALLQVHGFSSLLTPYTTKFQVWDYITHMHWTRLLTSHTTQGRVRPQI